MNPALAWRLVAAVCGLFGLAGAAYGADQHHKREQDQASHRELLQTLDDGLSLKEEELASLRSLLGDKNDQVRILAAEIEMLRTQAEALRQPA